MSTNKEAPQPQKRSYIYAEVDIDKAYSEVTNKSTKIR